MKQRREGLSFPPFCRAYRDSFSKWLYRLGKVNRSERRWAHENGVVLERKLELVLALLMPENALVARVMLSTGLRVGDVLELTPEQIKPAVTVQERKTGKRRRVHIPPTLCEEVLRRSGSIWAFPSPKDPMKHRTRQAVWADIKRAQKACRFTANLGTHSMRKAYAVRLMHRYGDLERVQKALQHDRPEVTMLYALADKLTAS